MFTIKEMLNDTSEINEAKLVNISDRLWEIGNLNQIKEKVTPKLFYLHIAVNVIGNWKSDGWWFLICEKADLIPYIPTALEEIHLLELKAAFENMIEIFPEYTIFKSDDVSYYEICNFLQSANIKVNDERLTSIPKDKRRTLVRQIRQAIDRLEELTEPVFGNSAECNGWKPILDYISANVE